MSRIDYSHKSNAHTLNGAKAAWPKLFPAGLPSSILDVGCGTGTWLRAATDLGVTDVVGVDGINIPREQLLFPRAKFLQKDLTQVVDLGRRFDLAISLEVGEHLNEEHAESLMDTLVLHSDLVLFSAACPGQPGQHHVNCQWPSWWQGLFNKRGFYCDDSVRWQIWNESQIEPWYRQNIFLARKDPRLASIEPRLKTVIHPDLLPYLAAVFYKQQFEDEIYDGRMPTSWYATTAFRAAILKLRRTFQRKKPVV